MHFINIRKPYTFLPALAILAVACTGNSDDKSYNNTDLAIADTLVTTDIDSDSIPQLPAEEKKDDGKIDAKSLVNPFKSTQEAIDFMKNSGNWDKYSTGILPEMAQQNLDYCGKLLQNPYKRFIVVDKSTMKVILFDHFGNVEKEYGMACAKNFGTKHKKADSRTPEGFFSAGNIYDSSEWLFTDDDGVTHPQKGVYGPKFVRVSNPVTTQIGIHGTSSPGSIGRRASHGCIRLENKNIAELVKYVETGMPIIVNPGAHDRAVNASEGCRIAWINTGVAPYKGAQLAPAKTKKEEANTNSVNPSDLNSIDTLPIENQEETKPEAEPAKTEEPAPSANETPGN